MKYFLYGKETTKEVILKYLEILLETGTEDFSTFGIERRFDDNNSVYVNNNH